ncbi:hypothetical protein Q1695_009926 [Nippostrongylus brasiliensis]|nr:hypothetical protein Q1695_009926 [Nippostrongylus brasiliensis]
MLPTFTEMFEHPSELFVSQQARRDVEDCDPTTFPTPSTSTAAEVEVIRSWVRRGGEDPTKVLFVCMWDECHHVMDTKDELAVHLDGHLDRHVQSTQQCSDAKWPCPIATCSNVTDHVVDLRRHLSMHQFHAHAQYVAMLMIGAKEDFRSMKGCGFPSSLDIVYSGEIIYCLWDDCNNDFSDPLELFNHVMAHVDFLSNDDRVWDEKRRKRNQYKCLWDHCDRFFDGKGLRRHVRQHSGEKYCACPFCGRFFSRPDKLYEHLRKRAPTSDSSDAHLCLLCDRRFGDERSLVNHVKQHINGRQCPTCGLAVQLPKDLHRHILVKHTERMKTMYCPVCSKSFYCATDLLRHSAVHAPPKEECSTCGERFRWKKQLDKHMLTHATNAIEKPYLCHICEATYGTGHGLTRHLSQKHECPVPEGFSRFSYKKCADGYYRLQTYKLVRTDLLEK